LKFVIVFAEILF